MTELEVPARAWELFKLYADSVTDQVPACVADIAAPLVATELRRQADKIATHSAGLAQLYATRLRARADEVDPEGTP